MAVRTPPCGAVTASLEARIPTLAASLGPSSPGGGSGRKKGRLLRPTSHPGEPRSARAALGASPYLAGALLAALPAGALLGALPAGALAAALPAGTFGYRGAALGAAEDLSASRRVRKDWSSFTYSPWADSQRGSTSGENGDWASRSAS